MDIETYLRDKRDLIDRFIHNYFDPPAAPGILIDAMTYSLFAGGKRIRPILVLASYEACGGNGGDIVPFASALEFIHTYSLIHDDLPAMDNDDLRRGKPTNHKVFGEDMAILAGDALLTEAFYILSNYGRHLPHISPGSILALIREVAMAAGTHGMVGGQAQDVLSEDRKPDAESVSFIHNHKTSALITASVRIGGILSNSGDEILSKLTHYGTAVGLAFQIIDDILDVEGETELLGKTAGSDERKNKMTYPALYGIDRSMKKAEGLVKSAVDVLKSFTERADPLRELALYILRRRN
jgi:geranylgeranyl diphosphate synthase, type II